MKTCSRCGERTPERSRFCPACGAPIAAAPVTSERRKVVTVVFADVVESTALGERVDSETLRWAMQRWFVRMRDVVQHHGGTVENYIGDAVMAVFGIPMAHEDDALRAIRAAAAMRDEVAALRDELRAARGVEIAVRMGVNTGEAVTGDAADGGFFTAGDIVNVAARLEQSARPGEILVGHETLRIVRHAVEVEPVAPMTVKGKSEALEAARLLRVVPDAPTRPQRWRAPMVGRQAELQWLRGAFARAIADRSCQLVTVLGTAGVGKSRLVAEAIEVRPAGVTVAGGRCLPYGDGLTWWPLVEALAASGLFGQIAGSDDPAIARAAELLKPKGEPIAPEEAFWAMQRVLETLARRGPLVLVVDDLQWAEQTFIDFVEHVANEARDAPLVLLVMARPDLLDVRPGWGTRAPNATSTVLEPLAQEESANLLRALLGTARLSREASGRILAVAEGNPLFVEEVVAMLTDDGLLAAADAGRSPSELTAIPVPPTIQGLLAARLDRLEAVERAVVEAASVEGKEFTRERLAALVDEAVAASVGTHLRALVRKELIRPMGDGFDTFRFRHQLIRDAAYEGMPKELRAALHKRFADWLSAHSVAIPVADELIGYHLETAVALRRDLGQTGAATAQLAARASTHLGAAGARAAQRDDPSAASALLKRATALVQSDEAARSALLPTLGASLFEAGQLTEAVEVLDDAIARAPGPSVVARARIEREFVRLECDAGVGTERARRAADEMLPILEREEDVRGQCRAWYLRAQVAWIAGHVGRADAAWGEAAVCARGAGDERELFRILGMRATAAVLGPTPVDEAIHRCQRWRDVVAASPVAAALMTNPLASLHAMRGEFERANRFLAEADETLDQLGSLGWVSHHAALVGLLEGRPRMAEVPLRAGIEKLEAMGDGELLATTLAMLAQAVYAQGDREEAERLCRMAAGIGANEDIVTEVVWRGVEARILADRGQIDKAEALAREAIALVDPTDLLSHRGDAMLGLADVLRKSAQTDEYEDAVQTALSLYASKGNVVGATRAQSLLNDLIRGA